MLDVLAHLIVSGLLLWGHTLSSGCHALIFQTRFLHPFAPQVLALSLKLECFTTLPGQIALAKGTWRQVLSDSLQPQNETLPSPFDKALSDFHR